MENTPSQSGIRSTKGKITIRCTGKFVNNGIIEADEVDIKAAQIEDKGIIRANKITKTLLSNQSGQETPLIGEALSDSKQGSEFDNVFNDDAPL